MTSPERVWSWSFNDWQEGWGGFARKEHLAPICERERDTGSEYVRIDLFKSQQAKLAKAVEALKKLDRRGDALETFDTVVHEIVTAVLAELEE